MFGLAVPPIIWLAVFECTPRRTLEILELARIERPQERGQAHATKGECNGYQPGKSGHGQRTFSFLTRSRRAFAVTPIEEADMAMAASSGVTMPAMASGTKTAL